MLAYTGVGIVVPAMVPVALNAQNRTLSLRLGEHVLEAELDPAVSPVVMQGAIAREERVIVQQQGDVLTVIGALRTAPTPVFAHGMSTVQRITRPSHPKPSDALLPCSTS